MARAKARAARCDADDSRETISLIRYPASFSAGPNAFPSLPGPTIVIAVFRCTRAAYQIPFAYIVVMARSSSSPRKKARILSSREVYKGPLFRVTRDEVIEPSGIKVRRDIVRHTGSVVILAVDESQREPRILLERQYRHAAQDYLWELPAGRIDEGESPLAAAKRELHEETGYTARQWKCILHFYASPGFVAEPMSVFLAQALTAGEAQPEADEVIEKHLVRLSKAVRMATIGTIHDSKTISSVLWFDHWWRGRKAHK